LPNANLHLTARGRVRIIQTDSTPIEISQDGAVTIQSADGIIKLTGRNVGVTARNGFNIVAAHIALNDLIEHQANQEMKQFYGPLIAFYNLGVSKGLTVRARTLDIRSLAAQIRGGSAAVQLSGGPLVIKGMRISSSTPATVKNLP
jgi:hypothetical protein